MTAARLTEREHDVLALMAEGLTNRQIAERLSVEQSTVRWYARQIYARLGAENRQEAIAQAIELGLVAGTDESPPPRHNLPAPNTPFIGRTRELARLAEMLADPAVRIITLIGPGGMGKTRLALALAEGQLQPQRRAGGLAYRYPDGIWFIPLRPVTNGRHLAAAFAEAMGLQFETESGRAPLAQLLDYLRHKRVLLVVDNFEHLVEEAGCLPAMAAAASGVQLLVTSRERLQVPGEQSFSLDGLAVPDAGDVSLAGLARHEAAQLFFNTARRVQPDLVLTEADAAAVVRICQTVAGMPLGIELAAAWASVLPVADIAREIEGSLDMLAAEWRGRPARHRSMQAALEASWQRLSPSQQDAFQRLCVFRGGFTRPAAFQVGGGTLPLLVTLVNKSWLTYDPPGDRYHIHELLRQYGLHRLAEKAALEADTRSQHSAFYAARLELRAADFCNAHQQGWMAEMQVELANIEQAWNWVIEAGDIARIGQMAESLARFYEWTGRLADGEAAMGQAADRLAGRASTQPPRVDLTHSWVRALIWQGRLASDPERQQGLLEEAQALLARWPNDKPELRGDQALLRLCRGYHTYGRDSRRAAAHYQQALELYRSLDDEAGAAASLRGLGTTYWALGQLEAAVDSLEAGLFISRKLGDERGVAEVLNGLALVRKHQGQSAEAERLHREVVESYQRLGSRLDEQLSTTNLAFTLAAAGKYEEMLKVARRAVSGANALGGHNQLFAQVAVGTAWQHLGRYEEARALLLDTVNTARATNNKGTLGFALYWLGQSTCVVGAYEQAAELLAEARDIFAGLQQNIFAAPGVWLSYTCRARQDTAGAQRQLSDALRLILVRRSAVALYDGLLAAALLTADGGKPERAAELYALCRTFPYIANSRLHYDIAGRHLEAISAHLPTEAAEAADQRGRKLDMWQTAEALTAEFAPA